jgi:hypothetical protein
LLLAGLITTPGKKGAKAAADVKATPVKTPAKEAKVAKTPQKTPGKEAIVKVRILKVSLECCFNRL